MFGKAAVLPQGLARIIHRPDSGEWRKQRQANASTGNRSASMLRDRYIVAADPTVVQSYKPVCSGGDHQHGRFQRQRRRAAGYAALRR
jgi:hypothetical protein